MARVLVVSSDVVGSRMAGPAIRATELARLLGAEHDVTVAAPPPLPADGGGLRLVEARRSVVGAAAARHDVLLVQGTALEAFPSLGRAGKPLVVDLYDPYVLENLEVHAAKSLGDRLAIHGHDLATMLDQARVGDFFLCASERQRYFWLGLLTAVGRVNPLTYDDDPELLRLLRVVPFGLPDRPPGRPRRAMRGVIEGIGEDDFVLLWGGGIWNWFDPLTLIGAVAALVPEHPELRLLFMGTRHPNPSIPEMRKAALAVARAAELGLLDRHVFFLDGWVPYAEREAFLAEADVGVSLHLPNVETTFSFRTRVLDYLWAGLPMLVTAGDSMAELVARDGLGVVVPPLDVGAAAAGLRRLVEDGALRAQAAASAARTAEQFRWSACAEPLLAFCRAPYRAADAGRLGRSALSPERGRSRSPLARKAWSSLRDEGPRRLVDRGYRFVRKRLM